MSFPVWRPVGTAAYYQKGINIEIAEGPDAGKYGIVPSAAPGHLLDGDAANVYRIGGTVSRDMPPAAVALWDEDGLAVYVRFIRSKGVYKIPAGQMVSAYVNRSPEPVKMYSQAPGKLTSDRIRAPERCISCTRCSHTPGPCWCTIHANGRAVLEADFAARCPDYVPKIRPGVTA
jgi:hypothetical protein